MDYVVGLDDVDQSRVAAVGGKGAGLAELSRIEGIRVPEGFCVTTGAFGRAVAETPASGDLLDRLALLTSDDRAAIATLSTQIRRVIEEIRLPEDLVATISGRLTRLGEDAAYAVRSSASAEDLPSASFAGLQESYLNVVGLPAILQHIRTCWASLFTERAVTYRLRSGFDHRVVRMAVVVQRMVFPRAAGVLFTADPVTSNRTVATVEATWGLGDGLVSGRVNGDSYTVRDDEVVAKQRAVSPARDGGTRDEAIEQQRQQPVLTDAQVTRLVRLGRRIEAHLGLPQDIEWCLAGDEFHIVQSRPITTLFPIPATGDRDNHVYVSVGHQQMMTDPIKPLGLSVWQLTTPRPMAEAGGRLFVDVTQALASPTSRAGVLESLGTSDPLIADALQTVLDREFIRSRPDESPSDGAATGSTASIETDPAIVTELIERTQASLAALERDIRTESGPALFDFILADIEELKRNLFDSTSLQLIQTTMEASAWLNAHLQAWLGETNAADTLTQSVPHNVTAQMGLALLDVADVMRPHPDVVALLRHAADTGRGGDDFLAELARLPGGQEAHDALRAFLDTYGMRCEGEIDITRPRWAERPATLAPTILSNINNFEPGAAERRFEQGRQQAWKTEQEILTRVRPLPDGEWKAEETKRRIDRVRAFAGYREYPKYGMVSRYFVYKQALLREADRLVRADVLREIDDVYYLRFDEFHAAVRTHHVDGQLIDDRKNALRTYDALTPPRVLTSDGEVLTGAYRRDDLPAGALAGLAVSAGTVEGRARVIVDMAQADLDADDILVTAYTDPSWTPLFVGIKGLVTEVGGLMTHGAVIAREYGLPAVIGVDNATRLIQDRQRIRVHGTEGYVEVLDRRSA